jgi:pyruvate/2-oxoglutarate dehydrogenase complex dihydrolipoamide dehydrogenase (E3) component
MSDPSMMEDIIASGKADIVQMARGLVCDPDLPNKARSGRGGDIVRCTRCLNCFSNLMMRGHMFCALNPEANRERSYGRCVPAVKKQKVLVAGGGIAGMQAALTAAGAGHEVILCEKSGRLGGAILCEEKVPFKKHLMEYIEQRERLISEAGITVHLNTEVTADYAETIGADAIVAAMGAAPVKPDIPGIDGVNVLEASQAYYAPEKVMESAVIIGGGLAGCELAIYLHSLGKKVKVVEMLDDINAGWNVLHGRAILAQMEVDEINPHWGATASRIDDGGVLCDTSGGERYVEGKTVIYAIGQAPNSAQAAALSGCAKYFYPIGDCVTPKTIADATATAMMTARDIGRF